MTNNESFKKAFRPALWLSSLGALIYLFACTFVTGSGIIETLVPIWLAVIFAGINFVIARIPAIATRFWARALINVAIIIIAASSLIFLIDRLACRSKV